MPNGSATYGGEIGFFQPAEVWNSLATSDLITTPPDTVADAGEVDFATVPFHLTFQHMINLLRVSKQENESLTAMLADLRQRASNPENWLSDEERDLAQILDQADAGPRSPSRRQAGRNNAWSEFSVSAAQVRPAPSAAAAGLVRLHLAIREALPPGSADSS